MDLVDAQYKYKLEHKVVKENANEKINEQMEVLNEWWRLIDPENRKSVSVNVFRDLLRKKRIITRDSEINRLFKKIIPGEVIADE